MAAYIICISLSQVSWISRSKLGSFILDCQDADDGGIADRPGNMADIFHTFFGIAGLSLLGYFSGQQEGLSAPPSAFAHYREIDPTYALPRDLVEKLGLQRQTLPTV
jgi:geranylgeranyl transferase type-2 subunit beta